MPHAVAGRRHAVTLPATSHLVRRFLVAAGMVVVCAAASGAQVAQQFYLTVLDRDGVPIHDLRPGEVTVAENGVPGQVTHLVRPSAPADVFLLVDTSRNFVSATPHLRRALLAFVDRLAGSARMSLMVFGGTPRTVVPPSMRMAEMRQALAMLFPSPGFSNLFDEALIEARRVVIEQSPRRPVVVAVTSSVASRPPSDRFVRDFLNPLTQIGTPMHIVALRRRPADLLGNLAEIARRTGGRFATVANHTGLSEPLLAIAEEIRGQYVLTYLRPGLPDDTEDIVIGLSIAREDVTVRVTPVL